MRIRSSSWAFFALVISFSAIGRGAFAFASVVTMPWAADRDAWRLAIISRWCAALLPNFGPLRGVACMVVWSLSSLRGSRSAAQRQDALVELLLDLVEAHLAEVGDVQQVVLVLRE